jgi:hypothetical protein
MAESPDIEAKRQQCWNRALEACGTWYIFQRRAKKLRSLRRVLTFFGILVPALIDKIFSVPLGPLKDPCPRCGR